MSIRLVLIVCVPLVTMSFAPPAAADVVENGIVSHNGNDVTAPGEGLQVSYWVRATNNDNQNGCNAADGTPLALSIVPSDPAVVPTPPVLFFTGCGESKAQQVVLISHRPGNYRINLAPIDGGVGKYDVNGAEFTLHVGSPDNEGPALLTQSPPPTEATGPGGAVVHYGVTASDPSGVASVSCTPPTGHLFPTGPTTVVCAATDLLGNTNTTTFTVTVLDTTPPTLTLPGGAGAEATSAAGATVEFLTGGWDIVDGALAATCTPPSGSTFPLGTTTVVCSATDASGNTAWGSFAVSVKDTTPPEVVTSGDQTIEAAGPAGAAASYGATGSDIVDGALAATCSPPSGSTFPLDAASVVTCTATDSSGNAAAATLTITVVDTTPPDLTTPGALTFEATGPNGAAASYSATASDLVDGAITPWCSPSNGSTFALGDTEVTCIAGDLHGNAATASFTVSVVDTTPPEITVPPFLQEEATGPSGASSTFAASASDIVDGLLAAACDATSGSTFALGDTTVTCSATDAHGNRGWASFTVRVVDTTPPALALPGAILLDATTAMGTYASWSVSAADIVDGPLLVTCTPGSGDLLLLGTTTVWCSATDAAGNTATGSFSATVWLNCVGPLAPWKADGKTTFKFGSTIPIKCKPSGGSAGVSDAVIWLTMTKVNGASPGGDVITTSTSAADTGNVMRWDPTGQQYIYNMASKPLEKGTWRLTMDFGGGNLRSVLIGLR